jgi:hypothetical protein
MVSSSGLRGDAERVRAFPVVPALLFRERTGLPRFAAGVVVLGVALINVR